MTAVDELQALTQSIGEHAVQSVGKERIQELTVILNRNDMTATVSVCLRSNTDAEQRAALEQLFDVQALFFDDVAMLFDFGTPDEASMHSSPASLQFSFA